MSLKDLDSYKPYKEYAKKPSLGKEIAGEVGKSILKSAWDVFSQILRSKAKM